MSTTYIWICLLGIGLLLCSIGIDASPFSDNDNLPPNSDVQGTGTDPEVPKRSSSFFLGSRYGRAQTTSAGLQQPLRNLNVVPRNNRFFTGSRYGKRSGENMQEIVEPEPSRVARFPVGGSIMQCRYTGVKDFYQCTDVLTHHNLVDSNTGGTSGIEADK